MNLITQKNIGALPERDLRVNKQLLLLDFVKHLETPKADEAKWRTITLVWLTDCYKWTII